jgi:flagellar hook-length control protein FliK
MPGQTIVHGPATTASPAPAALVRALSPAAQPTEAPPATNLPAATLFENTQRATNRRAPAAPEPATHAGAVTLDPLRLVAQKVATGGQKPPFAVDWPKQEQPPRGQRLDHGPASTIPASAVAVRVAVPNEGPSAQTAIAAVIIRSTAQEAGVADRGAMITGLATVAPSPATSTSSPPIPAHNPAYPHPAHQVAQAVTAAMRHGQTGQIDLTLRPQELGQIRFEMTTAGERIHVIVSAERPEALDLLRKHVDQLVADLRQSGFGQTSLGFGSWTGRDSSAQRFAGRAGNSADDGADADFTLTPLPTPSRRPTPEGRLDMRL